MLILSLLLVPTWLAVFSAAQGDYCLPPVGAPSDEVAAQFVLEAGEFTSVSALESEMSFCCPQQFTDCMAAGGVCMPLFVKSLCPLAVDSYCPADSCTCCIFRPPCQGLCDLGGQLGERRCSCRSSERPVSGKCSSSCTCCPLKDDGANRG
ncbi:uncharacterized protein [Penaeus vannamei]|uniref:uncharacterized protein n=1 Tax=Penaeus vannamei TaxID=6689 RepID=UPI00387FAB82